LETWSSSTIVAMFDYVNCFTNPSTTLTNRRNPEQPT
jgi:hypothetical protein